MTETDAIGAALRELNESVDPTPGFVDRVMGVIESEFAGEPISLGVMPLAAQPTSHMIQPLSVTASPLCAVGGHGATSAAGGRPPGGRKPVATSDEPEPDGEDFAAIYNKYFESIFRYARYRLGNAEEAEDVSSKIFFAAFAEHKVRAQHTSSIRTWLFAIAQRTVTEYYRAEHQKRPIEDAGNVASQGSSLEDRVILNDRFDDLRRALKDLLPKHRATLELRMMGLSDDEIAAVLGTSRSTVRTLQHRAISQLRRVMAGENGDTTNPRE